MRDGGWSGNFCYGQRTIEYPNANILDEMDVAFEVKQWKHGTRFINGRYTEI